MKKYGRILLSTLAIGCFLQIGSAKCYSQESAGINHQLTVTDSNKVQILKLKDGSSLVGRITQVGENDIYFETKFGTQVIPIASIDRVSAAATGRADGKVWFQNPNATRLFFAPNGRMLKKGHGYFSDYYLFFPGVAYGLTDKVTIGGGLSLVPGVGLDDQLLYFTPKIGLLSSEKTNIAAGVLLVAFPSAFDSDVNTAGILYGVATFGSADASATAGLGFGFAGSDLSEKPMIVLGFEYRFSRRVAWVSENWIFPGIDQPLGSLGLRFMGEALSVDLAFASPLGNDFIFPGIPFIDFVFNFK